MNAVTNDFTSECKKLKKLGQLPESKLCPSIRGLGAGPFVVEVVAAAKLSAVKECDL